jgi:hypothetical protein
VSDADARPTTDDQLAVDTIRALSMDAVEQANSGHPGTPMALAPLGHVLWTRHLRHDPADPTWPDRDRFVLSCGHASMLIYSLLHLTGYDLPIEELRASARSAPGPRGTRRTSSPRGSRRRPARSARASATRSAWRSPSGCSPRASTGPATRSSTTAPG